jgi:hypothetical protein
MKPIEQGGTMVARRKMIAGGLFAGLVGAVMAPSVNADAAANAPPAADENTALLQKIYDELQLHRPTCGTVPCFSLSVIRRQQHNFLKANARYPEFIDVGLGPWEELYDWQIKYQVPVKIGLRPDGFYSMPFHLTTIVLKPNMQPDYVGPGYDGSR